MHLVPRKKLKSQVEKLTSSSPQKGIKKIPTFCDMCFWKCGAIAYVRNEKLWKIEGNPDDPLSNGRLCPRGTSDKLPLYEKEIVVKRNWLR